MIGTGAALSTLNLSGHAYFGYRLQEASTDLGIKESARIMTSP